MCLLGISLHIYIKDVYSGLLPALPFQKCGRYVYLYILGISLHIYIKDMYTGHLPTHPS